MTVQCLLLNLRHNLLPVFGASKQPCSIASSIIRRAFSSSPVFYRKAVTKREEYFLKKDNIPPGFNIIYRAPMEYYLTNSLPNGPTILGHTIFYFFKYKIAFE